ncbi:unnamed protein product [Bursaphelenchus okinawaensis]|uniref:G-protein coupled receptors family 1 profile domain-containing protein n=1 Tax=Bursaphelenchus okinawaensis TaxID=465554 RepID=A0A811LKP7_9BILA|nr:unnamed protein product [Bursaphelenchus okinawaensis]CAG9127584.1 unnamed protein product [Bursaphelenchus okinawaensis]
MNNISDFSPSEMLALAIVFMIIIIIGFVGNTIVLFVIVFNRQLHDSTNILICNLALADLLFITFCVPLTAYSYIFHWDFSENVCYWMVTLQYVTCYVSVWTLVLLAYDRFFALWFIIFCLNLPNMESVGLIPTGVNSSVYYCVDSLDIGFAEASLSKARIFFWGFNLGAYVLPLALSTVFYLLLVKALWKEKLTTSKNSQRMKRHATKMVFTVIMTFAFCWFPQNFRFFFRGFSYPDMAFWEKVPQLLFIIQTSAQILAYANSCINPILYGVLSERFRVGVQQSWRRLTGCGSRRSSGFDNYKHSLFTKNMFDVKTPSESAPRSRTSPRGSSEIRKVIPTYASECTDVTGTTPVSQRTSLRQTGTLLPVIAQMPTMDYDQVSESASVLL